MERERVDCLVVGGGLIGLLTAITLREAGRQVVVLDRARPASESTWAGGGILSPLYPWRYPELVQRLATWSQLHYPALLQRLQAVSGQDPEYRQNGLLILDASEEREAAEAWIRKDGRWHQWVAEEGIDHLQPGLSVSKGTRALWLPWVGQVRNPRYGRTLMAAAERLGVRVLANTPIERLVGEEDGQVAAEGGGKLWRARHLIVASGAWSGDLLAPLGLQTAIRPVRGQMLVLQAEPELVRPILLFGGRYLIPRRDGKVLLGSTMEEVGFDKSITQEAREILLAAAARQFPELGRCPVIRHWSGLRPGSPIGVPAVGPVSGWRNLYLNVGHFRNGVVMGPGSARLLADLVLDREPILDPEPYRPDRVVVLERPSHPGEPLQG